MAEEPDEGKILTGDEESRIREKLLERKRLLWNEIRRDLETEASEKHREVVDRLRESGDRALEDLRESDAISLVQIKVDELESIEEALRRMEAGTYGRCRECGEKINHERLEALPYSTRCLKCQQARERVENV